MKVWSQSADKSRQLCPDKTGRMFGWNVGSGICLTMRAGNNITVKFANYQLDFFWKIYLLTDTMPCWCNFSDI
jgi:hypothetical protein